MNLTELIKEIEYIYKEMHNYTTTKHQDDILTSKWIGIKQAVEAVDKSKIIYGEKGDWGNDSKDFDEWQEILKLLNLTEIHKGEENGN